MRRRAPLRPRSRRYDQVILDLDGCVWVGPEPIPGSADAIDALREAGKRLAFVTNDSRHAGEDLVAKLWGIGVQASLADVVTVGGAMQHLLAETRQRPTAFVIGSEPLFRARGGRRPAGHERHRPGLAGRGRGGRRHATTSTYDDLKNAVPRRAPRAPTSWPPGATPPTRCRTASGRARARSSPPWRPPRAGPPRSWASPSRSSSSPRSTASGEAGRSWSATAWTADVAGAAKAQARLRPGAHRRHHGRGGGGGQEAEAGRGGGQPGRARLA